jgi:amidohydrolase
MLEKVRGCYFMLGSSNPEKGLNAGHHHPRFDFDEQVLPRAAALMAAGAMKLLGQ